MSASLFELLKYAQTGVASPSMTFYDKMRASVLMGGGRAETLTGIPPLTLKKSAGKPLKSWSITGNTVQDGVPTPDNPVEVRMVGDRTGNLFPLDSTKLHVGRIENDGTITYKVGTITVGTNSVTYQANETWRGFYTDYIRVNENENLAFSPYDSSDIVCHCNCYDENDNFLGKANAQTTGSSRKFTTLSGTKKVRVNVTSLFAEYTITNPRLNLGSTALPYEPYGYKIPVVTNKVYCTSEYEQGTLDGTTGSPSENSGRVRTKSFSILESGTYTVDAKAKNGKLIHFAFEYDINTEQFIRRIPDTWVTLPFTFTINVRRKMKFILHILLVLQSLTLKI